MTRRVARYISASKFAIHKAHLEVEEVFGSMK
jgi:hypothetical protein